MSESIASHKDRMVFAYTFLLMLLIPVAACPQQQVPEASNQVYTYLDPVYGNDQRLVSGPFYHRVLPGSVRGNPYFIDENWKPGSVEFSDRIFTDLNLKYDLEENTIVLLFTNINGSNLQIALDKSEISSFTIAGRKFIPFPGTDQIDTTRFCEEVVGDTLSYLVLRNKVMALESGSGNRGFHYKENITQWILHDGQLIPFRSKRTILKLFPEHKQAIKQFIRTAKIYPLQKRIDDRAILVRFCNTLNSDNE